MNTEATLVLMFVLATGVAIVTRKMRVPYTVALVIAGLAFGQLDILEAPHLTRELLFYVFIPGLVFEAAYHLPYADFKRLLAPIGSLAVPGVVAAAVVTALVLTPAARVLDLEQHFGWQEALLFGSLIAAIDPIAVIALFRKLGAPRDLGVLIEGESLLNDGTSIVLFTMIVGVVSGGEAHLGPLVGNFLVTIGGGAALGISMGLGVGELTRRIDDPMIEVTLTTIAAYGSFLAAEHFGVSGVIATVSAGMMCGNFGAERGMSASTRIAVETFWEYVAFALNSMVFLLIGFEVRFVRLLDAWVPILVAYLGCLVSRGVVSAGVMGLMRARGRHMPASWTTVLWWGGLRGGISIALALSLAPDFPHRDLLVTMTFGVVTLIILLHGLTLSPLIEALGLTNDREVREEFELARGRLQVAQRALDVIEGMKAQRSTNQGLLERIEKGYRERVREQEDRLSDLHVEHADLRAEEISRALRHVLLEERRQVKDSYRSGLLSRGVYERLAADIDDRLLRAVEGFEPREDGELERATELAGTELEPEDSAQLQAEDEGRT